MNKKVVRFIILCCALYIIPFVVTSFVQNNETAADPLIFQTGISVYINENDRAIALDFDEYLVGVVAAQMPGDYPLEALKVQAVIARTYAMNIIGERKVVEQSILNQSYYGKDVLKKQLGNEFEEVYAKIVQAVTETTEEYLTYEERSVTAAYFRCSNGSTRSCVDVWGSEVPYLISVESAWDLESPDYTSEKTMTLEEFIEAVQTSYSDFQATTQGLKDSMQIISKDNTGYVTEIQVGNKLMSGEELRYAIGIASASFEFKVKSKTITFSVNGSGHGVGLSQWGAKAMAEEGKGYAEILAYYYPGVVIS